MELNTVTQLLKKIHIPVSGNESSSESEAESELKFKYKLLSDDGKFCRVARLAYFKAEARGFVPGYDLEDWLAAEAEVVL